MINCDPSIQERVEHKSHFSCEPNEVNFENQQEHPMNLEPILEPGVDSQNDYSVQFPDCNEKNPARNFIQK